jgi:hypothetical protein
MSFRALNVGRLDVKAGQRRVRGVPSEATIVGMLEIRKDQASAPQPFISGVS